MTLYLCKATGCTTLDPNLCEKMKAQHAAAAAFKYGRAFKEREFCAECTDSLQVIGEIDINSIQGDTSLKPSVKSTKKGSSEVSQTQQPSWLGGIL